MMSAIRCEPKEARSIPAKLSKAFPTAYPHNSTLSPAGWLLIIHKVGSWRTLGFPHIRLEKSQLAAESDGAAYRIRTYDPRITNAMLYQLS